MEFTPVVASKDSMPTKAVGAFEGTRQSNQSPERQGRRGWKRALRDAEVSNSNNASKEQDWNPWPAGNDQGRTFLSPQDDESDDGGGGAEHQGETDVGEEIFKGGRPQQEEGNDELDGDRKSRRPGLWAKKTRQVTIAGHLRIDARTRHD
jgi:hypothetical protein